MKGDSGLKWCGVYMDFGNEKRKKKNKLTLRFLFGLVRKMVIPLIKVANFNERSRFNMGRCGV